MLISSIVGIDLRSTMDMDATIKGIKLSKESLIKILYEILKTDVGDNIKFDIIDIKSIMEEADYNGYRVSLKGSFETIVVKFKIDITTGDVITPKEIKYKFNLLFENRKIEVLAYNLETVISEKFESIISRGITNTRARDFYDIYILTKFQKNNYDQNTLKKAIKIKFKSRKTEQNLNNISKIIIDIENSMLLKELWNNYTNKYIYAQDITFFDVVSSVKEIALLVK